jgi:hypothetical protein
MSTKVFATSTASFRPVSRRASLGLLGGTGAAMSAALVGLKPTRAARGKKQAKQKCRKQVGQCQTAVSDICSGAAAPELCTATFLPCCNQLRNCHANAAVRCLFRLI